jgi:hypothetical protein
MNKSIKTLSLALLICIPAVYGMESNVIISAPSEPFTITIKEKEIVIPKDILLTIFNEFYKNCISNPHPIFEERSMHTSVYSSKYGFDYSMRSIPEYSRKYYNLRDITSLKSICKSFYHVLNPEALKQITNSTDKDISHAIDFHSANKTEANQATMCVKISGFMLSLTALLAIYNVLG